MPVAEKLTSIHKEKVAGANEIASALIATNTANAAAFNKFLQLQMQLESFD